MTILDKPMVLWAVICVCLSVWWLYLRFAPVGFSLPKVLKDALLVLVPLVVLAGLTGCSLAPQVKHLVVPYEAPKVLKPSLPVSSIPANADAATVFKAYESSLLLCIGYAVQLEAACK